MYISHPFFERTHEENTPPRGLRQRIAHLTGALPPTNVPAFTWDGIKGELLELMACVGSMGAFLRHEGKVTPSTAC